MATWLIYHNYLYFCRRTFSRETESNMQFYPLYVTMKHVIKRTLLKIVFNKELEIDLKLLKIC